MARHGGGGLSVPRLISLTVVLLLAIGLGWWAGRITLRPTTSSAPISDNLVFLTVGEESVGQDLTLNVTVSQPFRPLALAQLTGIVTEVPPLTTAAVGQTIYRVNQVPVRTIEGNVPFYRELKLGDRGADVAQLQAALVSLGYQTENPSGQFDATTVAALKQWQVELDQEQSGAVELGELIAVPNLPEPLRLGEKIVLGANVSSADESVLSRVGQPSFDLIVSKDQAALIPYDAVVEIRWEDKRWPAIITESMTSDTNSDSVVMGLSAPNGGLPCGSACDSLPSDESLTLLSSVQLIPPISGPAVPAAAIHTDPGGRTYVLMEDGSQRAVEVKGSSDGVVIVAGVEPGESVIALGGDSLNTRDISSTDSARSTSSRPTR